MFAGWRRQRLGRAGAGLSVLAATLLASSSGAAAVAPTRAEYVAAVEPICKRETLAHEGILKGVDVMVRQGRLRPAAPRLQRAADALEKGAERIAAVPRPTADVARLGRWLGFARSGGALLRRISSSLEAGKRARAEALVDDLLREARQANAAVAGFDFDYCRMSPARFV